MAVSVLEAQTEDKTLCEASTLPQAELEGTSVPLPVEVVEGQDEADMDAGGVALA